MTNLIRIIMIFTFGITFFSCKEKEVVKKTFTCNCGESPTQYIDGNDTITIPNLISDNSDGTNDRWQIYSTGTINTLNIKIQDGNIPDQTIYESNTSFEWQPSFAIPEGKYKYFVEVNGKSYTGFVCLIKTIFSETNLEQYCEEYDCLDQLQGHPYSEDPIKNCTLP